SPATRICKRQSSEEVRADRNPYPQLVRGGGDRRWESAFQLERHDPWTLMCVFEQDQPRRGIFGSDHDRGFNSRHQSNTRLLPYSSSSGNKRESRGMASSSGLPTKCSLA